MKEIDRRSVLTGIIVVLPSPLSAWPLCLEPRNPCPWVPSRRVL